MIFSDDVLRSEAGRLHNQECGCWDGRHYDDCQSDPDEDDEEDWDEEEDEYEE